MGVSSPCPSCWLWGFERMSLDSGKRLFLLCCPLGPALSFYIGNGELRGKGFFRSQCERKTVEFANNAQVLGSCKGGTASTHSPGNHHPGPLCFCVQGWASWISFPSHLRNTKQRLFLTLAGTIVSVRSSSPTKDPPCSQWHFSGARKKGVTYLLVIHQNNVKPPAIDSSSQGVWLAHPENKVHTQKKRSSNSEIP